MHKYKILVIDDENDIVETTAFMLRSKGFSVITAFDGNDGIIKAKDQQPDIIMLDLRMPQMDGFEVCNKLKSDDVTKRIPVIILTAMNDNNAHYKAHKYGADDYIIKPFILPILVTKINKFLYPKDQ